MAPSDNSSNCIVGGVWQGRCFRSGVLRPRRDELLLANPTGGGGKLPRMGNSPVGSFASVRGATSGRHSCGSALSPQSLVSGVELSPRVWMVGVASSLRRRPGTLLFFEAIGFFEIAGAGGRAVLLVIGLPGRAGECWSADVRSGLRSLGVGGVVERAAGGPAGGVDRRARRPPIVDWGSPVGGVQRAGRLDPHDSQRRSKREMECTDRRVHAGRGALRSAAASCGGAAWPFDPVESRPGLLSRFCFSSGSDRRVILQFSIRPIYRAPVLLGPFCGPRSGGAPLRIERLSRYFGALSRGDRSSIQSPDRASLGLVRRGIALRSGSVWTCRRAARQRSTLPVLPVLRKIPVPCIAWLRNRGGVGNGASVGGEDCLAAPLGSDRGGCLVGGLHSRRLDGRKFIVAKDDLAAPVARCASSARPGVGCRALFGILGAALGRDHGDRSRPPSAAETSGLPVALVRGDRLRPATRRAPGGLDCSEGTLPVETSGGS